MNNNEILTLKRLLINGTALFLSMGMVAVKAIWDANLLAEVDNVAFIAFGFIFPVIITFNAVGASLSNAVMATFSQWQWIKEGKVDGCAFLITAGIALSLGVLFSGLIWISLPGLISLLGAGEYQEPMKRFSAVLVLWLPFQFLSVTWQSLARGLGFYKTSSVITVVCYSIGMLTSYFLLIGGVLQNDPLVAIVLSSALTTLLFNAAFVIYVQT